MLNSSTGTALSFLYHSPPPRPEPRLAWTTLATHWAGSILFLVGRKSQAGSMACLLWEGSAPYPPPCGCGWHSLGEAAVPLIIQTGHRGCAIREQACGCKPWQEGPGRGVGRSRGLPVQGAVWWGWNTYA